MRHVSQSHCVDYIRILTQASFFKSGTYETVGNLNPDDSFDNIEEFLLIEVWDGIVVLHIFVLRVLLETQKDMFTDEMMILWLLIVST